MPVNLSAARLGMEWAKTSLTSVQASLQAASNAVMKSMNLHYSAEASVSDDMVEQLRHRGVMLKSQHKMLLKLFKRFMLQGRRIQQICNDGDFDHCSTEVEGLQTVDGPQPSELVATKKRHSHGEDDERRPPPAADADEDVNIDIWPGDLFLAVGNILVRLNCLKRQ